MTHHREGGSWEPWRLLHPAGPTRSQPNQGGLLPQPSFLSRTIQDLGIDTFRDLAVVLETAPILTALDIFVDRRVSALPVVDEDGTHPWTGLGGQAAERGRGLCSISSGPRVEFQLEASACFEPWSSSVGFLCLRFFMYKVGILITPIL